MNPPRNSTAVSQGEHDAIMTQAADWLTLRDRGFTAEEQEAFSTWMMADARHAAAVEELDGAWQFLQRPRRHGQEATVAFEIERTLRLRGRRRVRVAAVLLSGLAAAIAAICLRPTPPADGPAGRIAHRAEVKPQREVLPDGSAVELNAGAEIAVEFNPESRRVRLLRGDAHFAVAKGQPRPFIVIAGPVSVRAVGTEFAVRFAPTAVGVLVTEGRVAVAKDATGQLPTAATPEGAAYLDAGTRTNVSAEAGKVAPIVVEPVAADEVRRELAWRSMRVEFTGVPLAEIVAQFNERNATQITLRDQTLGELRLSGIFWLDDPESFARLLKSTLGVVASKSETGTILIRRE